jgi:hypothetical protein
MLFSLRQGRLGGCDWAFESEGNSYIFMLSREYDDIKLGQLYKVEALSIMDYIDKHGGLTPEIIGSFPLESHCLEAVRSAYGDVSPSRAKELAGIVHAYLDRNREKILRDLVDKKRGKVLQWDHVKPILLIRNLELLSKN